MNRSDLERLYDARDYARHALDHAGGFEPDGLAQETQARYAALYSLVIIGETLHRVSAAIKGAAPTMEWRGYSNLRNYVVHSYWQIDLEIVADVIQNRLRPLISDLTALIGFVERTET
jgi:uncharacterized protein with HEPN domain